MLRASPPRVPNFQGDRRRHYIGPVAITPPLEPRPVPSVLNLQSDDDPIDAIHRAVQALVEGKIVGVPTDTVYGLAASALSPGAVAAIYDLKGRDDSVPMAISVGSVEAMADFVCQFSPLARRLAHRIMPGPITLITRCDDEQSAISQLSPSVRQRITGEGGGVGFRVIDDRVMSHLHRLLSAPLVLTSANRSGDPAPTTAAGVMQSLGSHATDDFALLLDDGPTRYGGASTVVRVLDDKMEILRSGAIEPAAMEQFAKPLIAVVCTGNTCRSPMAAAMLRDKLHKAFGRDDAATVVSAGLAAGTGMPASAEAVEVMRARGLDLSDHASSPLSDDVLQTADVILTLTRGHRRAILTAWPTLPDRVHTLRTDGGDVADPVGQSQQVYQQCAEQIDTELDRWIETWKGSLIQ